MKTILDRKKEIAEIDDPSKIKEYLEEHIIDKSVNAEYSQVAQKEIIRFANKLIKIMTPEKKSKSKSKSDPSQQSSF